MPRIVIIDTYYSDFIETLPEIPDGASYAVELEKVLDFEFGTGSAYGWHLRQLGWTAIDIIANHRDLQRLWAQEHGSDAIDQESLVLDQIEHHQPDVVFCQNLSFFGLPALRYLRDHYILAGQCSCPMPALDKMRQFRVVLTSFPHYVERLEREHVKAVYLPLAFDRRLAERVGIEGPRPYGCVFVGGVGAPSHWRAGMAVLETVAREIPEFEWWGYGAKLVPAHSPLREAYQGPAFGMEMYRILAASRIVLNRHGEVAEGYTNNMRCYEATGMGSLLLVDEGINRKDLFSDGEVITYRNPAEAVNQIGYYLEHEPERYKIAVAGHHRTMDTHTYELRMKALSSALYACT